jgi:transposase
MAYSLRPSLDMTDIYLYREPVDFRKQSNGLAALVERELGHDPFSGGLYVFTNRHRNRIKMLMWENNGFVLYYKALAEEKFLWPRTDNEIISLTGQQINFLLDGLDILQMKGHRKLLNRFEWPA